MTAIAPSKKYTQLNIKGLNRECFLKKIKIKRD